MKINLISGESYLLINEKINEIVKDCVNITTFDLNINTIQEVIIEAGYASIFDEEKYIIVKNALFFGSGKLDDNSTDILLKYLDNPNPNSTIIFVCSEKVDARKKLTKVVKEKYNLINIPNLKFYEIEDKVMKYLNGLGFKIDSETVKYIVNNSLNNYDITMSEVVKLTLFYEQPTFIKHEDAVNIIAKSINTNNFLFVDALVDNDLEKSLALYNDLKTMKVDPTILLSLVARDFRIMCGIKESLALNKREYEIMNNYSLMDWQFDKYLKKVFPYKLEELESIIEKLANLDLKIKSGKIDRFAGLELFILDICE